ncbi:hypothetical protein EAO73_31980, partial [Streptomyces sp. col6]|uniref:hypothetical protein n=1 Tax=Streptomyces sp. col6 TaxID=2478958 RepID=UPI0011CEBCC8
PPPLPPETRLLLASDGSTTLLLESLLGLTMTVRVISQEVVDAAALPSGVREVLGLAGDSRTVRRLSELRAPDGRVVSRNVVAYPAADAAHLPDATDGTPLGLRLRALRFPQQHRSLLAHGLTHWDDTADAPVCAFKEYVIRCADESRIHIRERFNPGLVPVSDTAGAGRPVPGKAI